MMGQHNEQKDLFAYAVDLDRRIRADNPLRRLKQEVDWSWIPDRVKSFYGGNGNVSVDPVIIVKLMVLLFLDDVRSERELMRIVPERLDYLWFLGYGLDDEVPDHSVLSKARARWSREVFEELFVHAISDCLRVGLIDGRKIHMDGSLIDADASKDSVVESSPELIEALKKAFGVQEGKLQEGHLGDPYYQPVNAKMLSMSDPDAPCVRQSKKGGSGDSRPRYKQHRVVDDKHGVITAVQTTAGDVEENSRVEDLIDQHQLHTDQGVETVIGDQQYGTVDNYRHLQKRGIRTHMGALHGQNPSRYADIYKTSDFVYDEPNDRYICPAGQWLTRRRHDSRRQATEYKASRPICLACELRSQCTRARNGRSLMRHDDQPLIDKARAQAYSKQARADRSRRRHLMEGSFADASRHHFKRSRWRRLRNQQIQDWIIAAVQNLKIFFRHQPQPLKAVAAGPIGSSLAITRALLLLSVAMTRFSRPSWHQTRCPS